MASGGSMVQPAAASTLFDFDSDGVLCSSEVYNTLQLDRTAHATRLNSFVKDIQDNRMRITSSNAHEQSDGFSKETVMHAIEQCMEKYADNLMRNLEGISGRLTQLELHCGNIERSFDEFRSDLTRDQSEADLKLKSLEKHVYEIHRTVQIIRDKQELSETQNELTKFQLSQKSSEGHGAPVSENKANNICHEESSQKYTIALPFQLSSLPPSIAITSDISHTEIELPVQHPVPISLNAIPQAYLNQAAGCNYSHYQLQPEQHIQALQPGLHYKHQRTNKLDFLAQSPPKQEFNLAANQPTQQYHPHWFQPLHPHQSSSQNQAPMLQTQPAYVLQTPPSYALYSPNHQLPSFLTAQPVSTPASQPSLLNYNAVYIIDGNRDPHLQSFHTGSHPANDIVASSVLLSNHPY